MTKLIYASVLALVTLQAASAQSERELLQQWLDSHCQVNPGSSVCHQVIIKKQSVARPGTFQPYPGPIDLCPPPQFRLDPRDGCADIGLHRGER